MIANNPKYRLTFLLFLFLVGIGFSSCAYFNTYYNAKYFFKEGVKDNEDNTSGRPVTANYQKSINSAARVIEYYKDSKYVDDAILLMGKAYYEIRNYPKAKRKCEELITNYPESPLVYEARLYLGKTMIRMRKPEEGIAVLNDLWVEEGVPEEVRFQSQRTQADYYFEKENYHQALLEYEKVLESQKNKRERADIRYQIGECHYELKDYKKAEKAYLKVLDEKPLTQRKFEAMHKRAVCLWHLGDLDEALKICEKLLKIDLFYNFYDKAYLTKAGILAELERREEAVELYERILELYPRTEISAEASYQLGQIYWQHLKEFDKAQEYLQKVQTEFSQSEFVEDANKKVDDLRLFQSLNRGIDSLKIDLDTLAVQLEVIALDTLEIEIDSLQTDTLTTGLPDSISEVSGPASTQYPEQPPPLDPRFPAGQVPPNMQGGAGQYQTMQQGILPTDPAAAVTRPITIVPLPLDSIEVYARMDSDRVELAELRFRLAEHYWTRFDDADTAEVMLTELAEQVYNPDIQAKSLLSLYHLAEIASPDSTGPDSILHLIHENFPKSEYDRWVRLKIGLEPLPETIDTVAELFHQAEELWITENSPEEAISIFTEVTDRWHGSEWASKALYTTAWLQEHKLEDFDAAMASYDSLIVWYPQSEYVSIAQNKVAPPPPEVPDSLQQAIDDSVAALIASGELGEAPPGSAPPELIGGQDALSRYIHQNHLYPLVAAEAMIPGEAAVQFIVGEDGTPREFIIQSEDPEGFDFGESAIQALQNMTYRPAYRDGQYIEAPTTQIVRFEP